MDYISKNFEKNQLNRIFQNDHTDLYKKSLFHFLFTTYNFNSWPLFFIDNHLNWEIKIKDNEILFLEKSKLIEYIENELIEITILNTNHLFKEMADIFSKDNRIIIRQQNKKENKLFFLNKINFKRDIEYFCFENNSFSNKKVITMSELLKEFSHDTSNQLVVAIFKHDELLDVLTSSSLLDVIKNSILKIENRTGQDSSIILERSIDQIAKFNGLHRLDLKSFIIKLKKALIPSLLFIEWILFNKEINAQITLNTRKELISALINSKIQLKSLEREIFDSEPDSISHIQELKYFDCFIQIKKTMDIFYLDFLKTINNSYIVSYKP